MTPETHRATHRHIRGHADESEGMPAPPAGTQKQIRDGYNAFMARRGLPTGSGRWARSSQKKIDSRPFASFAGKNSGRPA